MLHLSAKIQDPRFKKAPGLKIEKGPKKDDQVRREKYLEPGTKAFFEFGFDMHITVITFSYLKFIWFLNLGIYLVLGSWIL